MRSLKSWWLPIAFAVVVLGGAVVVWLILAPGALPEGFASANGRIEATQIDVAAKTPGRVKTILVDEGDFVTARQVLAEMDTAVLEAQHREAEAQRQRAVVGVDTARSLVRQREAERAAAIALLAQREAERDAAAKRQARTRGLAANQVVSEQVVDDDRARFLGAQAAVDAARAQIAAAEASIGNARSQVISAEAAVQAAEATVQRIRADLDDSVLRSPRSGRVQYRVAEPGEVVGAGATVLNLVDLGDVYMTFFLPTAAAGRMALGSEVRLVLDAAPSYVIPARVSFVADVAQFTPKTVETSSEREKLMFRLRAQIDPALLQKHIRQIKTGLPGVAYVRLDPQSEWPTALQVRLPE